MGTFNLDDYEPVEARLEKFWADHTLGRVLTEMVSFDGTQFVFRAEVYREQDDDRPWATGYAHEVIGEGMVNKTSAAENCETSAIGRALANAGYATRGSRPSREEMGKANRGSTGGGASDAQKGLMKRLFAQLTPEQKAAYTTWKKQECPEPAASKAAASKAIDYLNDVLKPPDEPQYEPGEEPFDLDGAA